MGNKFHSEVKSPIYEMIPYQPNIMDTTDLEAATKTITATAEASGTVNADYSKAQTMPIPTDARLAIKSMAHRLSVTIDSDDGTHDLRCRVYVDAQAANNLLFDLTYSTTGSQLAVAGLTSGTIFNLLTDGAAHTLYFFFWSPGNHAPVVSLVQAWYGVGGVKSSAWGTKALTFTSTPACEVQARFYHVPVPAGGVIQQVHFLIGTNSQAIYTGTWGTSEVGAVTTSYPSDAGYAGMTWQMLPAATPVSFAIFHNVATAGAFFMGITLFITRWE